MTIFGHELVLDIADCDLEIISNAEKLREFASQLCKEIDMKPYGEPLTPHFGSDFATGYSLVQLIETSNITGHFSEEHKTAHINIFSCKEFSPDAAAKFSENFFKGKIINKHFIDRIIK